ncbi:DUF2334 domain-containing protein [Halobacillus sp. BAB-2008]|uniref:DUF2334 domain-containing protein n=1 Tax=Halobacillus sp. BAB-2008 TaxID=1246484 RepID=UPI0002A517DD|nr:DUF2334 domain-containing protein [Halobacillus sp. BAB-2008]ELK48629.1 hypothetical protein D479_02182 [Halobacillus sp. BAB-2008]
MSRFLTILFIWSVLLLSTLITEPVAAEEVQPSILVVYSSTQEDPGPNIHRLDMVAGHFTKDVRIVAANDLNESHIKEATHLIYFGEVKLKIPKEVKEYINQFPGKIIAFGHNYEQFRPFHFINHQGTVQVDQYTVTNQDNHTLPLPEKREISDIKNSDATKEWITAGRHYPLLLQKGDYYYYAADELTLDDMIVFGEVLHYILEIDHLKEHPAYFRLEDVHPLLDPKLLKDSAHVLLENDIPFMISVTPVYVNPKTGERYRLSDAPDLLQVLKDLQSQGAAIVLHGYTDQACSLPTGSGFEFIGCEEDSQLPKEVIEERIRKGTEELVLHGLEPVSFESSHYMIPQNGYESVRPFFTLYTGQLQLSDDNWRIMDESPFLTTPSFLKGIALIPETLRYKKHAQSSIEDMERRIHQLSAARDSVMSAFYHPYLGPDGLEEMIATMNDVPTIAWKDISQQAELTWKKKGVVLAEHHEQKPVPEQPKATIFSILASVPWSGLIIGFSSAVMIIVISFIQKSRWRKYDQ